MKKAQRILLARKAVVKFQKGHFTKYKWLPKRYTNAASVDRLIGREYHSQDWMNGYNACLEEIKRHREAFGDYI